MGIVLEFGESTTASVRTSPSPSVSPTQSASSRPNPSRGPAIATTVHAPSGTGHRLSITEDVVQDGEQRFKGEYGFTRAAQQTLHADERDGLTGTSLRAALVSVVDRWRGATSVASRRRSLQAADQGHDDAVKPSRSDHNTHAFEANLPPDEGFQALADPMLSPPDVKRSDRRAPDTSRERVSKQRSSPAATSAKRQDNAPGDLPISETFANATPGKLLLQRAARAREIYLASKYFNRWADRTATKLEREAVARRHMIRFRCFSGWSKAPIMKVPAIDSLRATTAVQKLRRAVAYQEQQLDLAASVISQSRQIVLARRIFERWTCYVIQDLSRSRLSRRVMAAVLGHWASLSREDDASRRAARSLGVRCIELGAAGKWTDQVQGSRRQSAVAMHISAFYRCLFYLGRWKNNIAIECRGEDYRRFLQSRKAGLALELWGLDARVQAYRWRCEYQSAESAFGHWLRMVQRDQDSAGAAWRHDQRKQLAKASILLSRLYDNCSSLAHLRGRCLLFIKSASLLNTFHKAVKRRNIRMKGLVRRYLMMRYTQVSSRRRKRNFYTSLDRWMALAGTCLITARTAEDILVARESTLCCNLLADWEREVNKGRRLRSVAHGIYRRARVGVWNAVTRQLTDYGAEALALRTTEQQRHCLKAWSIATLQRDGQAHTATVVQQRHNRETQSRAFQRWKQGLAASRIGATVSGSSTEVERLNASNTHRSSWRSLPSRLSFIRQEHDSLVSPMGTPTRWTGLALPMASTSRSSRLMATVQEADDESSVTSGTAGDVQAWRRLSRGPADDARGMELPSTTPRAPVPAHVEQTWRRLSLSDSQRARGVAPGIEHAHRTPRHSRPYSATAISGAVEIRGQGNAKLDETPAPDNSTRSDRGGGGTTMHSRSSRLFGTRPEITGQVVFEAGSRGDRGIRWETREGRPG